MPTRFGTTVITSSLFDNENIVLATIIKFNQATGILVALNESEIFSKELNDKIKRIKDIFIKNKKVDDIIKVLKVSNKDRLAIFDKIFLMQSGNITKQQMAEYVKKEVFKSITDVEIIEKKTPAPNFSMESVQPPVVSEEVVIEEDIIEEIDEEVSDLLDSIEDEPIEGDKDADDDETLEDIKDQEE